MRPMNVPAKLPTLKLVVVVGLYGVVWISLEGALWQVVTLSVGLVLAGALYLTQRTLGGRQVSARRWLFFCALLGGISGFGCALLALVLMAVKTGLHGHGPEFTPLEIEWMVSQMPLWTIVGGIAGLGVGTLALARQPQ